MIIKELKEKLMELIVKGHANDDMICRKNGKTVYMSDIVADRNGKIYMITSEENCRFSVKNLYDTLSAMLEYSDITCLIEKSELTADAAGRDFLYDVSVIKGHIRLRFSSEICVPEMADQSPRQWMIMLARKGITPQKLSGSGLTGEQMCRYSKFYSDYTEKNMNTWVIDIVNTYNGKLVSQDRFEGSDARCRNQIKQLIKDNECKTFRMCTVKLDKKAFYGEVSYTANPLGAKYRYFARNMNAAKYA